MPRLRMSLPSIQTLKLAITVLVAVMLALTILLSRAQAQDFIILYRFQTVAQGYHPDSGVILDKDGNLYGTNASGGKISRLPICGPYLSCGTVFKLSPAGVDSTLFSFTARPTGKTPVGALVRDADGHLYGAAAGGGAYGFGAVYQLDPAGHETVLHSFAGGTTDGSYPRSLMRTVNGDFYGTTATGGVFNSGILFKIDLNGVETVAHNFGGPSDGAEPLGRLIADAAGNLYGTTYTGGANGWGCVYKLDSTSVETVLYSFAGGSDGAQPFAGLTLDSDENLYGTTAYGGALNLGTVYQIDTAGIETVLHSFAGGNDGATPRSALVRDSAGNLYGTTYYGGSANVGTIFQISPDGTETLLHVFPGGGKDNDAFLPTGDLIRDSDGNFYGTTYGFVGIVYKLAITH